jgi:TonB family protein
VIVDEERAEGGGLTSVVVGDGDGLRRLVLAAIALLILALLSLAGYGVWRTVPRISTWIDGSWKSVARLDEKSSSAKPTITSPPHVSAVIPGRPRALHPRNPPGSWVTNDDYPVEAQRAGEQGTVAFTLFIDERGTPRRCEVTASSGSARLDQTACGLLTERARFIPALDSDGRPVPSTYSNRFRWVLSQ